MKLINRIEDSLGSLSKSERKVALEVLADPAKVVQSSIATLAKQVGVSEPTVNRFCRTMSCKGFPDFKLQLAQSLATGTPYFSSAVSPEDSTEEFTNKLFDATLLSIADAKKAINPNTINRVVDTLAQANRILFYGLGSSAAVAFDAENRFFRLGTPTTAYDDVLKQRMSAAASHTGDAVVIFSYTGRTIPIIEVAQTASQAGATVIGITAPGSPLANYCHLVIEVAADKEDTDIYTPMTGRIVHLTITDILATGVMLKKGPAYQDHLKRIKNSLIDTRIPKS
ncbi:MAG: transcriptional regulator HexR [Kangiellaceae bacterium]|nr:transcriptional regulator HexR [Kangiellaceae bacterium]